MKLITTLTKYWFILPIAVILIAFALLSKPTNKADFAVRAKYDTAHSQIPNR